MTRKDYIALANGLADAGKKIGKDNIEIIIQILSDILKKDNSNFNRNYFSYYINKKMEMEVK